MAKKAKSGACVETYLTVNEVALLVRLSVTTIRRLTMKREIPFHKINRAVRYKQSEIERWFDTRKVPMAKSKTKKAHPKNEGGLFGGTDCGGKL